MGQKVLVALGGNAILRHKEKGTAEAQLENVRKACKHLAVLIKDGHKLAITHGNGPQVGDILLKNELSKGALSPMPLDVCGAQSQGMIGYFLQQSMQNEIAKAGLKVPVVSLVTQTIVNECDPAFANPTKPIGPFFDALERKKIEREKGWTMAEDSGRGFRRVVPSPQPKEIVEKDTIKTLFNADALVIALGGGGIPVTVTRDGELKGVEAVIDKDLGAQILASDIGAEVLLLLTDVGNVSLYYGEPNQVDLEEMTTAEANRYLREGHFAPGSMLPKVEAAIRFVEAGGERAIVSSLETGREALEGRAGTTVIRAHGK